MECFAQKLESIHTASGGKKINIISHSMGGLLVKCFMALHSDVKPLVLFLFVVLLLLHFLTTLLSPKKLYVSFNIVVNVVFTDL